MSNEKNELKQAKEVCEILGINNDRLKYFKKRGVFVSETSRAGYTAKDSNGCHLPEDNSKHYFTRRIKKHIILL